MATFTYLYYQKIQIRKEIKHKMITDIGVDKLILFKFSMEESETKLNWEHSREFEFNNQMYDVIKSEVKGDTIHYWCWWDNEETILNKQLDHLVAIVLGNNPHKKEQKEMVVEFYKKLYYYNCSTVISACIKQLHIQYFFYESNYAVIYHSPPVPPPQFG